MSDEILSRLAQWRKTNRKFGKWRVVCDGRQIALKKLTDWGEKDVMVAYGGGGSVDIRLRYDPKAMQHVRDILAAIGLPADAARAVASAVAFGEWSVWRCLKWGWADPARLDEVVHPEEIEITYTAGWEVSRVKGNFHTSLDKLLAWDAAPAVEAALGFFAASPPEGGTAALRAAEALLTRHFPSVVVRTTLGLALIGGDSFDVYLLGDVDEDKVVDVYLDEVDPSDLVGEVVRMRGRRTADIDDPAAAVALAALLGNYPPDGDVGAVGGVEELGEHVVGFSTLTFRGFPLTLNASRDARGYVGIAIRDSEERVYASGRVGPAAVHSDAWIFSGGSSAIGLDWSRGEVVLAGFPRSRRKIGAFPAHGGRLGAALAAMGAESARRAESDILQLQIEWNYPRERVIEFVATRSGVVGRTRIDERVCIHGIATGEGFAVGAEFENTEDGTSYENYFYAGDPVLVVGEMRMITEDDYALAECARLLSSSGRGKTLS